MAHSTVATTNGGQFRALCSCGWEGEDMPTKQMAYRDRALHDATHKAGVLTSVGTAPSMDT